jgi:4-amino-4-deoxy-L-arabinose transferase-like glycosyltransferase
MHLYYWLMLAPPFAALTGIGARSLWLAFRNRDGRWSALLFPLAMLLTAVWQTYVVLYSPAAGFFLAGIIWLGAAIAALGFFRRWPAVCAAALLPLLAAPLFWSLTPLLAVNKGRMPAANASLLTEEPQDREKQKESYKKLLAFLTKNHGGERYLVVSQNARQVAPLILEAAPPVVAFGGFAGRDPILTVSDFAKMAAENQFRYVMLQRPGRRDFGGNTGANAEIAKWVREHGTLVDASEWRLPDERDRNPDRGRDDRNNGNFRRWDRGLSNTELYDLRVPPGSNGSKPS